MTGRSSRVAEGPWTEIAHPHAYSILWLSLEIKFEIGTKVRNR
ncbi:hypothetical protein HDA32_004470 [Spinactinospora alkalitolerans]|uniref:Uncharacterized protein n=1 Tax=Spinactinospora alkalitolerans TaxID=687207 RepID=A0A852U609_9ACTN|nr:hypothetical protein [Spinactinospora alkalitolerans]